MKYAVASKTAVKGEISCDIVVAILSKPSVVNQFAKSKSKQQVSSGDVYQDVMLNISLSKSE